MTQRHHHWEFPKKAARLLASCSSLWVEYRKAEQLPEASNKAPKQKARRNCVECYDVSKATELTQNYPRQLQLESELRQETMMWETKMSSMGHFQEGASANTSLLPISSHSSFASPQSRNMPDRFGHILIFIGPFHWWAKLLCLKNLICVFFL